MTFIIHKRIFADEEYRSPVLCCGAVPIGFSAWTWDDVICEECLKLRPKRLMNI